MTLQDLTHTLLTGEEAEASYRLSDYINAYTPENGRLPQQCMLIKGDVELTQLHSQDVSATAYYLIIEGNLLVKGAIEILSAEDGLDGLLVTGNVQADTLTMGDTHIVILGDLHLSSYLHTPQPDYESGEMYVAGKSQIPCIVQEDSNPELRFAKLSNKAWVTPEDSLHEWPQEFFDSEEKNYVSDIADLVAHIVQEVNKDPSEQRNYDWFKHLQFNPQRYTSAEKCSWEAWLQGALSEITEPPFGIDLAELKSICLRDLPLKQFPELVLKCHNLEQISLDNCFTYLPDIPDLSALTALRRLRLSGSYDRLSKHAPAPANTVQHFMQMPFTALDFLEIDYWHAIPDDKRPGKFKRRAMLAEDLQGIGRFQQLRGIAFYNNGLTDLPEDFFELQQLKFIRLVEDIDSKLKRKIKKKFPNTKIVY